ncbi:UNVERIFIED_CONTAM: hypothetical protein HHA_257670 [Hammondia hammondi]|eukprot:XP_008883221.1 hypothetical protein HHA_257670 [Hammondia hammondi]
MRPRRTCRVRRKGRAKSWTLGGGSWRRQPRLSRAFALRFRLPRAWYRASPACCASTGERGEEDRGRRWKLKKMPLSETSSLGAAEALISAVFSSEVILSARPSNSMRESVAIVEDLLQQVSGFHQLLLAELKTKSRDIRAFVAALTHRGLQLPVATKRPGLPTPPPLRRLRRRLLSKQKAEARGFDAAAKAGLAEERTGGNEGEKKEKEKEKKEGEAEEERGKGREEEEGEGTEEKDAKGYEEEDVEEERGGNGEEEEEEEGEAAGGRKGKAEAWEEEGDAEGNGEARSDGERKVRRGELRRRGGNAGERRRDKATRLKEGENEKRKESLSLDFEASPKTSQRRNTGRSRRCEMSTSPSSISTPSAGTAPRNATPGHKNETPCRSLLFLSPHSSSPHSSSPHSSSPHSSPPHSSPPHSSSPHSPSSPSRPLSLPSSCSSAPQPSPPLTCAASAVQDVSHFLRSDASSCRRPRALCTASLGAEREESRDAGGEGGETSLLQERQRAREAQRKRRGDAEEAQRALPASLASSAITGVSPGEETEAARRHRRRRRRMSPLASPSNSADGVEEPQREEESTPHWRQHPSLALPRRDTDSPSGSAVHTGERESKTRGEEEDTCKSLEASSPSDSSAPSRSVSASSCASGASPLSATETSLLVPSPSTRSRKRKRTLQASALTSSSLSPSCNAEEKDKTNGRGTIKSRRVRPPSTPSSPSLSSCLASSISSTSSSTSSSTFASLSSSLSSSSTSSLSLFVSSPVSFSSTSVSDTGSRPDSAFASDAVDGGAAAEKQRERGHVRRSSQQEGALGPHPFSDTGARESSSAPSHSAPSSLLSCSALPASAPASASSSLSSFALIRATSSRGKSIRGGRLQRPGMPRVSGGDSCLSASAEQTGVSADAPREPASERGRGQPAAGTRKTGGSSARRSKTGGSGCAEGTGEGETSEGLPASGGGGSRDEEKARTEAMEIGARGGRERLQTETTAGGRRRENGESENACSSASASSKAERGRRSEKTRREEASPPKEKVMRSSSTDSSSEDAPMSRRRPSLCLSCESGLCKTRKVKTSPQPGARISPSASSSPQSLRSSGPPAYASHLSSSPDAASSCASASVCVTAPDCGVAARAPASSAVSRKGEEKSPQEGSTAEEKPPGSPVVGSEVVQRGGLASCRQRGAERRANSGRPAVQKVSRSSPRGSKGIDGKARKGTADDLVPSKEKRVRLGDEKDPWLPSGGQIPQSQTEPPSSASGSKGPSSASGSKKSSDASGSKEPSGASGSKEPSGALGFKGPPMGGEGYGPLCGGMSKSETSNSARSSAEARIHGQSTRSAQSVSPLSPAFSLPSSLAAQPVPASLPEASDSVRGAGTHKQETDKKGKETDEQGTEKGEEAGREHGGRQEQRVAREGVREGRHAERAETLAPCHPDLPSVRLASGGVPDLGQARERTGERRVEGGHSGLQLSRSDAETLSVSALTIGASSEREKAPCREEERADRTEEKEATADRREGEEEQKKGEELEEETTEKRKREDTQTSDQRPRGGAGEARPTQRAAAEARRQATRVEPAEAAEEVEEWDVERGSESGRSRSKCAGEETRRHSEREPEREDGQTELTEEAGGERGAKAEGRANGDREEKGERRGKGNNREEGERERGEKGERERDNNDGRGERGKSHGSVGHGWRLEGGEEAVESRRWRREEEERSGGDRRDICSAQRSQRSFFSSSQKPCSYQPLWAAQQQERRRCFSCRRGSGSGPADRGDSRCTYTSADRRPWSRADRTREGKWRSSPPRRDEGSRGRGEEKARHRESSATHSAVACRPSYGEESRRDEGKWWLEQGRPERHESRNFLPPRVYLRREDAECRSSWDRRLPPASFYQSKSLKSRSFSYSLSSKSSSSSSFSASSSSSSFSASSSSSSFSASSSSSSFSSSASSSSFSASSASFSSSTSSASFSSSASSSFTSSSSSSYASFSSSTSTFSSPSLSAVFSPHAPVLSARASASDFVRTSFLEPRELADAAAELAAGGGAEDSEETKRPRTLSLSASPHASLSFPSSSSFFSSLVSSSTVSSFASASSCLSSSSAASASFSSSSRPPSSSSSSASASSLSDSVPAAPEAVKAGSRVAEDGLRLCASGVSKSVSAGESPRAPLARSHLDPPCDQPGDGCSEEAQKQKLSSTDGFSCDAEKDKDEATSHSGHSPSSLPSSHVHLGSPFSSSSLSYASASSSPSSSFSSSASSYLFSSSPFSTSFSSSSSVSSFRSEREEHRRSPARLAGPALGPLRHETRPSATTCVSSKAAATSEKDREAEEGDRAWGVTERGDGVPEKKAERGEGGRREHARRLEEKAPRLFSDGLSFRFREECRPESDRGERSKRLSPNEVETLDVESKMREEKRTERQEEQPKEKLGEKCGKRGTATEARETSTRVQTRDACDEGTTEERTKKKKGEGREDGGEQQAKEEEEEEEEEEEGEVKEDAPGVQGEERKKACRGETPVETVGEANPWEKEVKPSLTLFGAFRAMPLQVKETKALRKVSREAKDKEILKGKKEKDPTRQSQRNHPETRTHTDSLSSFDSASVSASASSFSCSSTSASSSSSASPPSSSSSSPAFPSRSSSSSSSFLSTPKNEEGERGSERGPEGGEAKETKEANVAKTEEKKEKAEHSEKKGDGEKDPEVGPRGFAALDKDDRDARARTVGVSRSELSEKKEDKRAHAEPGRGRATTDRGKREEEPSEKTAKEAETKGGPPVWSPKREGPVSLPRFTGTGETKGKTEETKRCSSFSSSPPPCALLAVEQVARVLGYSASEKTEKEKEAFLGNSALLQVSSVELGRTDIQELSEPRTQREAKGDKGTGAEHGGVSVQLTEREAEEGQTAEAQREGEESEGSANEAELKNVCLTLKKELEETLECNVRTAEVHIRRVPPNKKRSTS